MKSEFLPVHGLDGVYAAQFGKLSCVALRLLDGSLCLYSPVAGLEKTLKHQTSELGTMSALLAPNHYHNKGLAAHVATFPDAALYCSCAARPRLSKITGLKFDLLDRLKEALPDGQIFHEPHGLKTGEIWVQINSVSECALVVTDAYSSAIQPPGTFGGNVTMLGTFPRYGVKDARTYKTWVAELLSNAAPTMLIPCHGSPVRSPNLTDQLTGRLDEVL